MQGGLSQREQSLSSPTPEALRAWRLFFESALAVIDVLEVELERDAGFPLPWYDVLVQLEDEPDGRRMNELAERILKVTGSASELVFVPYEQVYGHGVEEMFQRMPSIEKIDAAIGWAPTVALDDILAEVVEHAQRDAQDAGLRVG